MKKLWPLPLILLAALLACTLPSVQPAPTATPTLIPPTNTPIPTPTGTPTPMPSPTPTPIPAARVASGDQALFYGDWDAALVEFNTAFANSSDAEVRAAAMLGIGRAYYGQGEYSASLNALRDLAINYPDTPAAAESYFIQGQVYARLERYIDAADAYINYLARRSGVIDAYVYELRGDALAAAGDHLSALNDYLAAYQSPRLGTTYGLEIKLARTYAVTGDYATALVLYQDLYNRASDNYTKALCDYQSGQIYGLLGETEKAYAAYLDAVTYFPQEYNAYLSLFVLVNAGYPVDELQRGIVDYFAGQFLQGGGLDYADQYGAALQAFDRYLNAGPVDPARAYYYKGLTLLGLTNSAGAVGEWDKVIQGYPESPLWDDAWEQKGYIQWAYLDQYDEATLTLQSFVTLVPTHARAPEFLFDAARVLERAERLQEAAGLWEAVALNYPFSEYAFRSIFLSGISLYRLGQFGEAHDRFERSHSYAANNTERSAAYFWMAKSLAASGDQAAAKTAWEHTASLDPTGYYSERAGDILAGQDLFAPPEMLDIGWDIASERAEAETWMRQTFGLLPETDFSGLGDLVNDLRFVRGQEFWRLGLYEDARLEFESLRQAYETDLLSTYRLTNYFIEIGLYRSAIFAARQVLSLAGMDDAATLNAPIYFNHIRFGTYFSDLVFPDAQENSFHPLFVWSVMRQESFFEGFIRSPAGARGLMQIMPGTGQTIVERVGWPPNYTAEDLYRPVVSIRLGIDYLAQQRDAHDGDLYTALAAYNAGPGNASIWKDMAQGDSDLYLEIIRLSEPQLYIKRIYEIYAIYLRLYNRAP